ncbi:MAG: tetratricopeptide repeat protein [Candidatus Obscuribacterales bacterium]|nr:tetratricopeptide repeat protein [Candidatus Obscuribacterales bacterium]
MAKPSVKQKMQAGGQKPRMMMQQKLPVVEQTGPGKDKLSYAIFGGILGGGVLITTTGLFYTVNTIVQLVSHPPINWVGVVGMSIMTVISLLILRFLVWAAFFASAMFAARTQSWQAQEKICRWAMSYRTVLPGGASWAVQALLQQMLNRGQYKEAMAFGGQEYDRTAAKNPKDQSLASLCACVGLAYQVQGDIHGAILWNERAVELFAKVIESVNKSGPMKKFADKTMLDGVLMQYVGAYANLGAGYFNVGNYGKAKKNFSQAIEEANKLPDSAEKQNIVRAIKEHMGRLKHW